MPSHEYIVEPGGRTPPNIDESDLFAATIAAEPVLILLPRFTVTSLDVDGNPAASDAFEAAVRAHGAQAMTELAFPGGPAPGWSATITAAEARITGPGIVGEIYTGSTPAVSAEWFAAVADSQRCGRGIVVITGAAASNPDAALEMIEAGRASWVRVSLEAPTS